MEIPSSPSPEPNESGSPPLTFDEVKILAMATNLASPSSAERLLYRRAPLKISIKTIYETVIGVVTGKLLSNKNMCSAMLEALCCCMEYCCGNVQPQDRSYQKKVIDTFRTLAPLLSVYMDTPIHGPWILRLLTAFYRKEGMVPDSIVHDLLRILKVPSMRLMPQLQESIAASLHALHPYKPVQIPSTFRRRQVGHFPEYRSQFQIPTPTRPLHSESDFPVPTFQSRKAAFGLYPPAALHDPENFHALWEKMKVPDHIRNLLTDPILQYHWLLTPNDKGCSDEKRLTSTIMELFMPPLSDDGDDAMVGVESCEILDVQAAENAFRICRKFQETIIEPVRIVTSCAVRFIDSADCPDEIFFMSIQNISLLVLGRDNVAFKLLHEAIRDVYIGTKDFERKIAILDALHRMVFDFESCLPRLWMLEGQGAHDQLKRIEDAFGMFKQEEVVGLAADVDVTHTLNMFINCFDDIVLNIALKESLERDQNVRLWGSILRILQVLVDFSTFSKQPPGRHTVYCPHFGILKAGLYHVTPHISNRVKSVTERYLDILEKINRKSIRTRELKEMFSKWRKR